MYREVTKNSKKGGKAEGRTKGKGKERVGEAARQLDSVSIGTLHQTGDLDEDAEMVDADADEPGGDDGEEEEEIDQLENDVESEDELIYDLGEDEGGGQEEALEDPMVLEAEETVEGARKMAHLGDAAQAQP